MHRPRAMLFDMDGTLTRPMLDFAAIRAEMGIGDRPILEAMAEMPPDRHAAAQQILLRHEDAAAERSELNEGCEALLAELHARRLPVAVITRNSRRSATVVFDRHGLTVDVLVTRDDGLFKPDPAPLRLACERLGVPAGQAWMVGDGEFDIQAGIAAGAATVWLSHGREERLPVRPWRAVLDLRELHNLLLQWVS